MILYSFFLIVKMLVIFPQTIPKTSFETIWSNYQLSISTGLFMSTFYEQAGYLCRSDGKCINNCCKTSVDIAFCLALHSGVSRQPCYLLRTYIGIRYLVLICD